MILVVISCWKKQDHEITPPAHPDYKLSGTVTYEVNQLPAVGAEVSVAMTELYQGDVVDSAGSYTNESGHYTIGGLFRGRYDIMVKDGLDTLFMSEFGIIKYEDKQYDIVIAPPDTTLES